MKNQSEEKNSLIKEVHEVFGDIPFPEHCGWNAAIAKDDWIDDPIELRRITDEKDIKGKWWEIPAKELDSSLPHCYLDAQGVEFYLPACLVAVLNDDTERKYQSIIYWFDPPEKDDKDKLYLYFIEQFSRINKAQKDVCIKILQYFDKYLIDPRNTFTRDMVENTIEHEFWKS